jgi:hypothetical protein
MWWECSECGGMVRRSDGPAVCPECGTAGAIFMRAEPDDPDDPIRGDADGGGLRAVWLRAGLEQPELIARG